MKKTIALLSAIALLASAATAAIGINTVGETYSQNFDTLGNTDGTNYTFVDDTTITGWHANSEEMDSNSNEYWADDGDSNSGEVYSYGTGGATERALGYLGSGGNDYTNFAVALLNNTGGTLDKITVNYTGEQWRSGGNTNDNNNVLVFSYQVFTAGAGSIPTSTDQTGWTTVSALDFEAPQKNLVAGSLDGNIAENQTTFIDIAVEGLSWANGQELWLRFSGNDGVGTDAGLAVDDFSVTVLPEPMTISWLGIGGLGLLFRRAGKQHFCNRFFTRSSSFRWRSVSARTKQAA